MPYYTDYFAVRSQQPYLWKVNKRIFADLQYSKLIKFLNINRVEFLDKFGMQSSDTDLHGINADFHRQCIQLFMILNLVNEYLCQCNIDEALNLILSNNLFGFSNFSEACLADAGAVLNVAMKSSPKSSDYYYLNQADMFVSSDFTDQQSIYVRKNLDPYYLHKFDNISHLNDFYKFLFLRTDILFVENINLTHRTRAIMTASATPTEKQMLIDIYEREKFKNKRSLKVCPHKVSQNNKLITYFEDYLSDSANARNRLVYKKEIEYLKAENNYIISQGTSHE